MKKAHTTHMIKPPKLVANLRSEGCQVYVGRPSKWGNPFKAGRDGTREEVISKYESYIRAKPELVAAAKRELKGKVLGCWCAPLACHADVLARIANEE